MEYKYITRGKCTECGQVCWIDKGPVSVSCKCHKSNLTYNGTGDYGTTTITDEEFKTTLRTELGLDNDEPITLIQIES
jgi:hypothetical protein